jgi:hypothetical protein
MMNAHNIPPHRNDAPGTPSDDTTVEYAQFSRLHLVILVGVASITLLHAWLGTV